MFKEKPNINLIIKEVSDTLGIPYGECEDIVRDQFRFMRDSFALQKGIMMPKVGRFGIKVGRRLAIEINKRQGLTANGRVPKYRKYQGKPDNQRLEELPVPEQGDGGTSPEAGNCVCGLSPCRCQ